MNMTEEAGGRPEYRYAGDVGPHLPFARRESEYVYFMEEIARMC